MDEYKLLVDFGPQPVSNRFRYNDIEQIPKFPLSLSVSDKSGLIRLNKPFPVSDVRPKFNWITCFEPEDHLDRLVDRLINLPGVSKKSVFGGFSFKDDTTLRRLENLGFSKTWRVDPNNDLNIFSKNHSIETLQDSFDAERARKIAIKKGYTDVFIVRHVVEHAYDIKQFISSIKELVTPNGYIIWELPDCERSVATFDFTTIWEEHIHYFTRYTFQDLIRHSGLNLFEYYVEPYPLENSIVAITSPKRGNNDSVIENGSFEEEYKRAKIFSDSFSKQKAIVSEKLTNLRDKYGSIALFGAGHLAVAFLSIYDVSSLVHFVIDDNENKKGMWMPVENMQIKGSDSLYKEDIGVCLLSLNPQNHEIVMVKNKRFSDNKGIFASIFPGTDNYFEDIK